MTASAGALACCSTCGPTHAGAEGGEARGSSSTQRPGEGVPPLQAATAAAEAATMQGTVVAAE
jgi:hypothetical protein